MAKANQAKTTRKPRQPKVYADEQAILTKLDALSKKVGDGEYTDAQKTERSTLRGELGTLRFKRLAKTRVAKAVQMIRNIGNLGGPGYVRTPEQIATIGAMLTDEVKAVVNARGATKKEKASIEINL